MSAKFVRRYAVNYFVTNIRKMLAVLLLLLLVEGVCGTAAYLYGMIALGKNEIADAFSAKEENLAVLTVGEADPMRIIDAIQENKHVRAWGQSTSVAVKKGDDKFFSALGPESYYSKTTIVMTLASVGMLDIVDSPLNRESVEEVLSRNRAAVFVPENYKTRGINTGDLFTIRTAASRTMDAEVAGFLPDGFAWVNTQDYISGIPDEAVRSNIGILTIVNDDMIDNYSVLLVKKDSEEEWENISKGTVSAFAIDGCVLKSFPEMFTGRMADTAGFREYLRRMLILLVCVSVLTIISVLTVATIQSRKVFGVWYANGASQRDVVSVLLINSLLLYVLASALMVGIGSTLLPRIIETENWLKTKTVFFHYAVPMTLALVFGIVALGTVFPIIMVRREPPAELVKGFID